MEKEIIRIIENGIELLGAHQQEDGSFLSLSSQSESFERPIKFHSIFTTAIILLCLTEFEQTPLISGITKKIAAFLLQQKSNHWSFNYWARDSIEYKKIPYPDDLDDTFCAIAALYKYDSELVNGEDLAAITSLLTTLETEEGGPYRTWLVSEKAANIWLDIDLVVNSNIAYFLFLLDIKLPKLSAFIEKSIVEDRITSPYYPEPNPIIYFISRFYKGRQKNKLIKNLKLDNSLNVALAVLTRINLGVDEDVYLQNIKYIKKTQEKGSWKPAPFYAGVNPKRDEFYYAGSSDLTSIFCLFALQQYLNYLVSRKTQAKVVNLEINKPNHQNVVALAIKNFSKDGCLKKRAEELIKEIVEEDRFHQITLISHYFQLVLGKKGKIIPDKFLDDLGIANLYGWLAYTIYDDFLDDEGKSWQIPVANTALRRCVSIFDKILSPKTGFRKLSSNIFDKIDEANNWEVANARFDPNKDTLRDVHLPDWGAYEKLAQRSMGHALGPIAILFFLGYSSNSAETKKILTFFKHFIIAKQLNDDLHDWQDDYKKGHLTPVVVALLTKLRKGKKKALSNKKTILSELQKIFWYHVIVDIGSDVVRQTKIAREALNSCVVIENPELFNNFLLRIEDSTHKALSEQKKTLEFLKAY